MILKHHNKIIIDATKNEIFLMIMNKDINYSITHENTKTNYEKLTLLIKEFLDKKRSSTNRKPVTTN